MEAESGMMEQLRGKTALISGAVSGIGLGIAKTLAREGTKIALGYRRLDHLEAAMGWFKANGFSDVHPVRLDVADVESWRSAADETEAAFGKIHLLINNAGTTFAGTIDKATPDDWQWIMQVNFQGVVNGLMTCIPRIRRHGEGGHIVNVSSMAAYLPAAEVGLYSASKFAVRGLTAGLRPTLAGDNIGVSELAPGLTRSNIHHAAENRPPEFANTSFRPDPGFVHAFGEMMSLGMDPEEVGRKAVAGILANVPVIFSHPEFREEFRAACEELIAAFPDEPVPPERQAIEDRRRNASGSIIETN
jgi:NAD(P)-dependent dehydrogenase (short-subunit alcohol dehydrogenase family)